MKIRAKIKIGDLVELLGCNNSMQEMIAPSSLKINTPSGYEKVEALRKTQLNPEWKIKTKSFEAIVADKHRVETKSGMFDSGKYWKFSDELLAGEEIFTENGWEKVEECKNLGTSSHMYDLQVANCHSYFANGIHGHNSIFLPNFGAKAVFTGFNVVHYSLEMSEERVGLRYDGPITGIDINHLPGNADTVIEKYDYMKSVTEKVGRLIIKEFQTAGASVLDIESHLEMLKTYENFTPDVIIVDYGDIMNAVHKSNNNYEEQGWVFRELRGLAQKYDCVVITATQARRDSLGANGGTKATVGMDQVADSMEKNRILDGLFSIVQSPQDKLEGIIKLFIAKNRNGPSGVSLDFNISYSLMRILDKDTMKKEKEKAEDIPSEDVESDQYMGEKTKKAFAAKMAQQAGKTEFTEEELSNKYAPQKESDKISATIE